MYVVRKKVNRQEVGQIGSQSGKKATSRPKIRRISVDAPVPVSRYFGGYRITALFAVFSPVGETFRHVTI
jgi:hypothetical protein